MRISGLQSEQAFRVFRSTIHGRGVVATRDIARGVRLIEYAGEHISNEEADRRHEARSRRRGHTLLFTLDEDTVIDGGVKGNESRFINHSCAPNCEAIADGRAIFIQTRRKIAAGEELTYDYAIERAPDDPPGIDDDYACRCGSPRCRGTMLVARRRVRRRAASKKRKPARKGQRTSP